MKKVFLASLLTLLLSGCYNPKTHGQFITEHENAWMNGAASQSDEHEDADQGLVFCQANIDIDTKVANPKCYRAEFKKRQ